MIADLLRLALVVGCCALGALVVRVALQRRRGSDATGMLPWWTTISWLGYIVHALFVQIGRFGHGPPSWRFWLVGVSTIIGIAGMRTIVSRRVRHDA